MFRKISSVIWLVAIAIFCWLMIDLTLPYLGFDYQVDFLLTKQKIIHVKHWRYSFNVHILFSIISLGAGFTQFSNYILKRHQKLHRYIGYAYAIDVLFLAGPSGLIMGFYANGTAWAKLSFVLLAILWMTFTAMAYKKALQKDFVSHRNWMIRSYALTLSAITLRLLAMALPNWFHLEAFFEYTLIAWLSWTLNLLIAELIIVFKSKSNFNL